MFSLTNLSQKNQILHDCVDFYYFLKSDQQEFKEKFTHYPHYRTTLNIYKESNVKLTKKNRLIKFEINSGITTVFTNNISDAKTATIEGPFNVIGILFKPLGINHFLKGNSILHLDHPICFLNNFWLNYKKDIQRVFNVNSNDEKVLLLDSILMKLYHPLIDDRISKIVEIIQNSKGTIKVKEIETTFNINRRTLLRLFKKHLGCTISEFKQVIKFRNAVNSYQNDNTKTSFTELSYSHNYYDQSDFINHFKTLTGEIPKEVLPKVTKVGQKDLYWKFKP